MATTESSNREALQVLNSINIFTDKENFVAGKVWIFVYGLLWLEFVKLVFLLQNVHRSKQQQPPSSLIGSNPGGAKQRSDSSNIILRSNCESAIIPASFNSNTIAIYQDDDDDVSGSENHQMIPVAVQQNPLLDETRSATLFFCTWVTPQHNLSLLEFNCFCCKLSPIVKTASLTPFNMLSLCVCGVPLIRLILCILISVVLGNCHCKKSQVRFVVCKSDQNTEGSFSDC